MVYGYHVILGTYGFWLPNDPRGSWSDFVGGWELLRFGRATRTESRASFAHEPHDRAKRLEAKEALKYPPVSFSGVQARAVGRGFARYAHRAGVRIWACSILPQHVHLVIARHDYKVEQIANLLKGEATRSLIEEGLHPGAGARDKRGKLIPVWSRSPWKVYLDSEADIRKAIAYVEENPVKEGKPRQHWNFIEPFD